MNPQLARGGAGNLDVVEICILYRLERDLLAGDRIAVPVRQHKIIGSARQPGPVVDARPGGLPDSVAALPPPALVIPGVVNLHLMDRRGRMGQRRGHFPGVEAEAPLPFPVPALPAQIPRRKLPKRGRLQTAHRPHLLVRQHAVEHRDLVEVPGAHVIVAGLHLGVADHPGVGAELIQPCVQNGLLIQLRRQLPVDIEPHAHGLVPGKGHMEPLIRLRQRLKPVGHPQAAQVDVRHKCVDAVPVVIDAHKQRVPAGVIRKGHPE